MFSFEQTIPLSTGWFTVYFSFLYRGPICGCLSSDTKLLSGCRSPHLLFGIWIPSSKGFLEPWQHLSVQPPSVVNQLPLPLVTIHLHTQFEMVIFIYFPKKDHLYLNSVWISWPQTINSLRFDIRINLALMLLSVRSQFDGKKILFSLKSVRRNGLCNIIITSAVLG